MSEAGCVFCAVVAALEGADTCPAGDAGHVLRKVRDLPAWHLFPRYEWDPNPKRPTWKTNHTPRLPEPAEYDETVAAIRRHLG